MTTQLTAHKKNLFSFTASKDTIALPKLVLWEEIPLIHIDAILEGEFAKQDEWKSSYKGTTFKEQQYENEVKQLQAYKKNYKKEFGIKVEYQPSTTIYGRTYPLKSLGLTSISKDIREAISKPVLYDFDIENAMPSILHQLASENGLVSDTLKAYCDNRQEVLDETMEEYEVEQFKAKNIFIRLTFDGTFYGWKQEWDVNENEVETPFINKYKKELKNISKQVVEANKHTGGIYKQQFKKKSKEMVGSSKEEIERATERATFAIFNQHLEWSIVSIVMDYLMKNTTLFKHTTKPKSFSGAYEFDGFRLPIPNVDTFKMTINEGTDEEKCLEGISGVNEYLKYITEKLTGYKLSWKYKAIGETHDLEPHIKVIEAKNASCVDDLKIIKQMTIGSHKEVMEHINLAHKDQIHYEEPTKSFFVWSDKKNRWETSSSYITDIFYNSFMKEVMMLVNKYNLKKEEGDELNPLEELIISMGNKLIQQYNHASTPKHIIETAKWSNKIEANKGMFRRDTRELLLGFDNGVLDLENHIFRAYKPEDRITLSTGYDFDPIVFQIINTEKKWENQTKVIPSITLEEIKKRRERVMKIYNQTFAKEEFVRHYVLLILSSGLCGKIIQKFFIFNGAGRNGKGVISGLYQTTLGSDYCLSGAKPELLEQSSFSNGGTGANSAMCMIDYKRVCIFKEPKQNAKLCNEMIKRMTGGDDISSRDLNEKERTLTNHMSNIMECNNRPLFANEVGDAECDRIRDIHFSSHFVETKQALEVGLKSNPYTFIGDSKVSSPSFREDHKLANLAILLEYFEVLRQDNFNTDIHLPISVMERTKNYMYANVPIISMFREVYEFVEGDMENEMMEKPTDIMNNIQASSYFQRLPNSMKLKLKKKDLIHLLKNNPYFAPYVIEMTRNNTIRVKAKIIDDIDDDDISTITNNEA